MLEQVTRQSLQITHVASPASPLGMSLMYLILGGFGVRRRSQGGLAAGYLSKDGGMSVNTSDIPYLSPFTLNE